MKSMLLGFFVLSVSIHASAFSYIVPTENPALKPYAEFQILDLQVVKNRSAIKVTYTLPTELTGEAVKVTLTGRSVAEGQEYRLRGENGRATCVADSCQIKYRHLEINETALQQRLGELSANEEEFAARLQVARGFEGNPIGVLSLKESSK